MRTSEARTDSRSSGATMKNLDELRRVARKVPSKLRRRLAEKPEATLAAVAGLSFLAGVTLGSRLARAVVSAAIPIALERLIAGELGPRLMRYATELWSEAAGAPRAVATRAAS